MPLFYQHNINDSTKLAVWYITENEDFFLEKVSIKKEIMHPHKRLQHLAGRYLLQILYPGFPIEEIKIAESKKPFLIDEKLHFSISHCREYAAAIVSENKPVGIDAELITPKIELIKTRFLSQSELKLCSTFNLQSQTFNLQFSAIPTLFWSAKEAIYKWHGKGALSFKNNMKLNELLFENDRGYINAKFINKEINDLRIEFRFFGELCLAWV
ncbi:MAG TPA: 4'-phosphopantetheinyl transferase superfamily protein [Hanamia sp.]|jgi:phosphopantetheinyl transferase|nr:4'-phosphopantetheinyl transferase superfamily protein [Hanamia sp.]